MSRWNEVGRVATTVAPLGNDGSIAVTYHRTQVVIFNASHIKLDSGGWKTATTKVRMNQASNQYSLGYQVYQANFDWFVSFKGKEIPFSDNMILVR